MGAIGAIVMLDRVGKGIRTAPRDALISLSASPKTLGMAFGVHRAMDTTGAMLGPLVAFGILALAPLAFSSVFLVSFCVAVAGLGVIVLLVPRQRLRVEPPAGAIAARRRRPARRPALPRARRGGVAARARDDQRRVPLSRAAAPPRAPADDVPAAVRRLLARLHAARRPDRPARRPRRPRAHLRRSATCCSCRSTPRCSRPRRASRRWRSGSRSWGRPTRRPTASWPPSRPPRSTRTCAGAGSPSLTTATNLARFLASVGFGALWTFAGLNTAVLTCGIALVAAILVTAFVLRADAGGARPCVAAGHCSRCWRRPVRSWPLPPWSARRRSADHRDRARGALHRARPPVRRLPRARQGRGPGASRRADVDAGGGARRTLRRSGRLCERLYAERGGRHLHRPQPLAPRRLRGAGART